MQGGIKNVRRVKIIQGFNYINKLVEFGFITRMSYLLESKLYSVYLSFCGSCYIRTSLEAMYFAWASISSIRWHLPMASQGGAMHAQVSFDNQSYHVDQT